MDMKSFRIIIPGLLLAVFLLAVVSCRKEDSPLPDSPELSLGPVLPQARVCVGHRPIVSTDTKASYASRLQEWNVGDRLVATSINASGDWAICGTLSCIAVSGSAEATFEGTLTDFTPRRVNFFFLGNRDVDTLTPTFDCSVQRGTAADLVSYLFLELRDARLEHASADVWTLDIDGDSWAWSPLMSILTLDLTAEGTPGATAGHGGWNALAKFVSLKGLRNAFRINLAGIDPSLTPLPAENAQAAESSVMVSPFSVHWARSYPVAIIPQTATLSMAVNYRDRAGSGTVTWHYSDTNDEGVNFRGGIHYKTSWTGDGFEIIGTLSSKNGYNAVNIDGGDNPDGTAAKNGYNGVGLELN